MSNLFFVITILIILFIGVTVIKHWFESHLTMEDLVKNMPEGDQIHILYKDVDGERMFVKDPKYWGAKMDSVLKGFEQLGFTRDTVEGWFAGYIPYSAS